MSDLRTRALEAARCASKMKAKPKKKRGKAPLSARKATKMYEVMVPNCDREKVRAVMDGMDPDARESALERVREALSR